MRMDRPDRVGPSVYLPMYVAWPDEGEAPLLHGRAKQFWPPAAQPRAYVVYCTTGIRSAAAAVGLQNHSQW